MERLTVKRPDGRWAIAMSEGEKPRDQFEKIPKVIDRLAAYEDTGLEPEQVKDMAENAETRLLTWFEATYGYSVGELMDLLEAKQESRLAVLSTPMIPLVQSEDSMNTDVYCPRCGESVSGGWPNAEPDSEWKLCQCPCCGQSVDEWKVISREEAERAMGGGGSDEG